MTLPNKKSIKLKWVQKYSVKPFLKDSTINWYKSCQKMGRREFLKRSRIKTNKFNKKNPGNLQWRVFKTTILKNKDLSYQKLTGLKSKIHRNQSVKGIQNTFNK